MLKELLQRADWANIGEFIMHGGSFVELPKEQTNEERMKEAYNEIHNFIKSNFEEENCEDKAENLNSAIGVLEYAYFELGLISGIKLGAQLQKKMAEML